MNEGHAYTPYHPRWLRRRVSTYWWLTRRSYLVFILRELSSVFVAWYVAYVLLLVHAVGEGEASYQQFLDWSRHPLVWSVNLVGLLFAVFHAITWFNLAPQAMVVHVAGRRLPGTIIAASNYGAWIVTSALLAWILLGG